MKIIKSRLFKVLVIAFCIGLIIGIICFFMMSKSDKGNIESNLINYINLIENDKYNYGVGLLKSLYSNISYVTLIWIFGIIFILSFIIPILIIYKGITLGISLSSIIYSFGIKGILYDLIFMFNSLLYMFVFILMSYYSINFSIKCFNSVKNNKMINIWSFVKNYLYLYLILSGVLLLCSIIEIFISSNILKFIV